jgi:hypothetical protein
LPIGSQILDHRQYRRAAFAQRTGAALAAIDDVNTRADLGSEINPVTVPLNGHTCLLEMLQDLW